MAIAKAERLMNLALCLLGTRRPLSKRELRESVEAYLEAASDDAFNRMFERDKDDLRELGLVIETVENLEGEVGYLARRDSNRLPPITLDAEEAAALGLAAKVWQQARLAGAASGALQKLRAAGLPEDVDPYGAHSALEPRIPVHEAAFEPLMLACRDRRPVVFDYRKATAAQPEPRHVEPWALECWRGHWYLAGWDRDRGAERVFRLSRITGKVRSRGTRYTAPVPDVVTVRETVASWAGRAPTAPRASGCAPTRGTPSGEGHLGAGTRRRLGRVGDSVRARPGRLAGGVRSGRGGPGARRAAGRRGGPAARRGQGLRGTDKNVAGKPVRPVNAIDQTRRMLSLVTYLRERPGARIEDVARAFGITEDELVSDLDVLPMCGTSFRGGDLLDIDTDGERIWWHNPAALGAEAAEPLRLAADEATALLVAARAVATLPGLRESDRQALLRATAKVETAAGEAAGASARLSVTFESEGGVFADVDRAIAERRRLWIRYYSPARDELSEREIDPIRLVSVGHTYVEAWCRRSEARRTFRLDRVAEIKILDEPSAPPEVELRDLSEGLVQPAAEDPQVVVEVGPGGRWVAEYYPHDSADELPDGGLRITLRTPDPASLKRLALRLGRDGRIVAPDDLADSARRAAREALAAYDGTGTAG